MTDKNQVGGCCANGHLIVTEGDLSAGSYGKRCKACRRLATQRYRSGQPKLPRHRPPKLLEVGHCQAGHPIVSEDDLYVSHKRAGVKRQCRACHKLAKERYELVRADREWEKVEVRRWVYISCGCRVLFRPHYPLLHEQLWCVKHAAYAWVDKVGEQITREEARA